jgi:hypothetical protein
VGNRLVGELVCQRLPSVDFAHGDLTRGKQRSEQHGCGLGRGQHCLGLDPTFELLVEPFDRVGGTRGVGGIVNLAARGMLVVSAARRLGSEGPLLACCAAPL